MDSIDLFYDKGKLELCTFINEPTNKFMKLSRTSSMESFLSTAAKFAFQQGSLTRLICDGEDVDLSEP